MVGAATALPSGQTWRQFSDEAAAVTFAKKAVQDGMNVRVGELGAEKQAKYQTTDIAKMLKSV